MESDKTHKKELSRLYVDLTFGLSFSISNVTINNFNQNNSTIVLSQLFIPVVTQIDSKEMTDPKGILWNILAMMSPSAWSSY